MSSKFSAMAVRGLWRRKRVYWGLQQGSWSWWGLPRKEKENVGTNVTLVLWSSKYVIHRLSTILPRQVGPFRPPFPSKCQNQKIHTLVIYLVKVSLKSSFLCLSWLHIFCARGSSIVKCRQNISVKTNLIFISLQYCMVVWRALADQEFQLVQAAYIVRQNEL